MSSEPPQAPQRFRGLRRFLLLFSVVFVALAGLLAAGSLMLGAQRTLAAAAQALDQVRGWLHAAQLAAIAWLWWRWDAAADWLARRGWVHATRKRELVRARHRLIALLLLVQLLVVMGVPFRISGP